MYLLQGIDFWRLKENYKTWMSLLTQIFGLPDFKLIYSEFANIVSLWKKKDRDEKEKKEEEGEEV